MESKDDARDRGGDLPLFAEVARFFQDQAFMCAKDEGLEVVFDDFVSEHAALRSSLYELPADRTLADLWASPLLRPAAGAVLALPKRDGSHQVERTYDCSDRERHPRRIGWLGFAVGR